MNKKEVRESVASDVEKFLRAGGMVETLRTTRRKVKNPASGKQKMVFFQKAPPKQVHSSWGLINGIF